MSRKRTAQRQQATHNEVAQGIFKNIIALYKEQIVIEEGRVLDSKLNEPDINALLDTWDRHCDNARRNPKMFVHPRHEALSLQLNDYAKTIAVNAYNQYLYKECKARYNMVSLDAKLINQCFQDNSMPVDAAIVKQFQHLLTSYKGLKNNPDAKVPKSVRYKVYFKHYLATKWGKLKAFAGGLFKRKG